MLASMSLPTSSSDLPPPIAGAFPGSARRVLPETRRSLTHKFNIGNHEGYLTIGLHADGRPGEVFIKMSKEGSTMSGMCQAFCRAFSIALQYGLPLEDAVARFKGMRFEPMGPTSNPEIPEALSIVDYVARYLELHFSGR
jgi:ribonucleoside-diphosphate reductase alpha chain